MDDSPEGLYSFYNDYLSGFFLSLPLPQKFHLLSRLGVDQFVSKFEIDSQDWKRSALGPYFVYSSEISVPVLFPATEIKEGVNPEEALRGLIRSTGVSTRWKTRSGSFVIPQSIRYHEISPAEYRIDLKSEGPVFIASRITYFPVWKATGLFSDGQTRALRINQVDLSFVGIEAPEGVSSITLRYVSHVGKEVLWGWGILLLAVLVAVTARMPRSD
jgi:hypothetical protein